MVRIAENSLLYRKAILRNREISAARSYNLIRPYTLEDENTGEVTEIQEADLVFLPRTFNISALIGQDKFGLCISRVPSNSIFILRLANARQAWNFFNLVAQDINTDIPCSPDDDWINNRIEYIDSPQPFNMPNHPYLGRETR